MGNQIFFDCGRYSAGGFSEIPDDNNEMFQNGNSSSIHFQMTKIRRFSHYSRDFQAEQKYNRIKQRRPDHQVLLEIVYPQHLLECKDALMGIKGSETIDDKKTVKKSFKLATIDLSCLIRQCATEEFELSRTPEEVACGDVFLFLLDEFTDLKLTSTVIAFINSHCKQEALVFLIAAKGTTTTSFLDNSVQRPVSEININSNSNVIRTEQGNNNKKSGLNESKLSLSSSNMTTNSKKSVISNENTGTGISPLNKMKLWAKSIIHTYCNTDFILIDYDCQQEIDSELENILCYSIYSQDTSSRMSMS